MPYLACASFDILLPFLGPTQVFNEHPQKHPVKMTDLSPWQLKILLTSYNLKVFVNIMINVTLANIRLNF